MTLAPPPARLVGADGALTYGMFEGVIDDPNLEALRVYGPLTRFRFKQWQHVAVITPSMALTFAVVDAGFQRVGWAQAVDRRTGAVLALERQGPLLDVGVAPRLGEGRTWLRAGGLSVAIHNRLDHGEHLVDIDGPGLHATLRCLATVPPLSVCLPLGRGRGMYSYKVPLPVEGRITVEGRHEVVDPAESVAIFDVHKAHYPHRTFWRWGTFAGHSTDGRAVAVNVTNNVVIDPALHENVAWIDGALVALAPPVVDVSGEPWSARGEEVDLHFTGDGERREALDVLGLVRSRFRQRFGRWRGVVLGAEVEEAWGLAEDHDSRW